eukprot:1145395-Pelagomonas_calceolata.AAC.1
MSGRRSQRPIGGNLSFQKLLASIRPYLRMLGHFKISASLTPFAMPSCTPIFYRNNLSKPQTMVSLLLPDRWQAHCNLNGYDYWPC